MPFQAVGALSLSPGSNCHRDGLTGSARATVPDAVPEQPAHQESSVVPAGMPRAEHRASERAVNPRPARQPGNRHAVPRRHAGHHPLASSPAARPERPVSSRARPGKCTSDSAADVKPEHAASAARPWPSVENRRLPGPSWRADAVRYTSADPRNKRSWPNVPEDHVNTRPCPLYVRTAEVARRLTPRTATDSVRTPSLTCGSTVVAPPGQRQATDDSLNGHHDRHCAARTRR